MAICMIAAVGKNLELGKGNDLIWHFKDDMAFFKETTMGSSVIMGRKTFESLPKALPRRKNIVITTRKDYEAEGATVVNSIENALKEVDSDNAFIIGGGDIYPKLKLNVTTRRYFSLHLIKMNTKKNFLQAIMIKEFIFPIFAILKNNN